ncbi:thiamine phosphate synthase [Dyadobacter luteus]|jgi:thiamine-phosphate pyrophosphorylase|uniref:Thiamine-phosphate synthase n=1 Tax=Dyadobacter luteus TaxID=2259619 RepID=A0A3D8YE18_9BACT|nr:thiamine phosphate synthase [Dyadobacter luteus]REA62732.1 thiamine phosphate synthase [Dyadobacter luteus]
MNTIDKLQFISNQSGDLSHLDSIRLALDAGCRWIQLRMKDESDEIVVLTATEAKQLCDQYDAKLIINDFAHIAGLIDAYGLHLGLNDMSITEARKLTGSKIIIGGTANTLADVQKRIEEGADYIGLGPYRFTNTKQNLSPILGLRGYRNIVENLDQEARQIPIIAIGGIQVDDVADLAEIGIHGIAVSSLVIQSKNPKELVSQIQKTLC